MNDLHKLREKLCRELSQSEHSAVVQPRREARRLGNVPPAHALSALADHAASQRPRLDALVTGRQASQLGAAVGELFSTLRNVIFDRMIDTERSYRATLLGLDHGVDIVRLLAAVAAREGDGRLLAFCEEWLAARLALLEHAQRELAWFANQPQFALQSGMRRGMAMEPEVDPSVGCHHRSWPDL